MKAIPSQSYFAELNGHDFMNLTSFRKSGQPVKTPVWFAYVDEKLYVMTMAHAGKVKRIRNNAQVLIEPCNAQGEPLGNNFGAIARILTEAEYQTADQALNRKYGLQKRMFDLIGSLRRASNARAYLEINIPA